MSHPKPKHPPTHKDEPYYTNEDIAILHDIVVHAEEQLASLPERERIPTNALFHSYYSVLPSIGIDAEHDSRYARILFKIGGRRGDQSLYEKFEDVLSQMGIEIQYENSGSAGHGSTSHFEEAAGSWVPADHGKPNRRLQSVSRRNSDTSMNRSGFFAHERNMQRPRSSSLQPLSRKEAKAAASSAGENRPILSSAHKREQISAVAENHGGRRGLRAESPFHESMDSESDEMTDDPGDRVESEHDGPRYQQSLHSRLYSADRGQNAPQGQPESLDEIDDDVNQILLDFNKDMLVQSKSRKLLRRCLLVWHDRVRVQLDQQRNMELAATTRDRYVLTRQALDNWLSCLNEKRQLAETERFYDNLEYRAQKARNIYILAKAFLHWASTASEEMDKATIARHHILRNRLFQAWKEVTAVNELKIRQHRTRRCFGAWRRALERSRVDAEAATEMAQRVNLRNYFWAWFWAFCEKKAPEWYTYRSRAKHLTLWRAKVQKNLADSATADVYYGGHILSASVNAWNEIFRARQQQDDEAERRYKFNLQLSYLRKWRYHRVLKPKQDSRRTLVLQTVFSKWRVQILQKQEILKSHATQRKRKALLQWNVSLRCSALHRQIDTRIVLEVLYKWALAERLAMLNRMKDGRLLRSYLQLLKERSRNVVAQAYSQTFEAQTFETSALVSSTLRRWRDRLAEQKKLAASASSFASRTLLPSLLHVWMEKAQLQNQLNIWADNALFFFTAKDHVHRWRQAMEASRRQKRRDAFVHMRRQHKVRLALQAVSIWRSKSQNQRALFLRAADISSQRHISYATAAFSHWRDRTRMVKELEANSQRNILRPTITKWRQLLVSHHQYNDISQGVFQQNLLAASLKKWTRLLWKQKANQHLVIEVREKYSKRNVRRMIIHWRQQVKSESLQAEHQEDNGSRHEYGTTQRAELWSDYGDENDVADWVQGFDSASTVTAVPGYLATPSKKPSLARAMATLSTTTPNVPLPTPFERHLRAQLSMYARTPGRKLFSDISRSDKNVEE